MPNRILREAILTSDRVDGLSSWAAEVFYRRLMSVVDDYGRFDGRASVIRSAAYPLKLNTVGDPDIGKWLDECESAGLVRKYTVDGKPYLELLNFRQQVRCQSSRYPDPLSRGADATQMHSNSPVKAPRREQNSESQSELVEIQAVNGNATHLHSICVADDHLVEDGGGGVFGVVVEDEGGGGAANAHATQPPKTPPRENSKGGKIKFDPVPRDLFRREYEAMIADAQEEINLIKQNPKNKVNGVLTPEAEALRQVWVARKKEIRNAMNGIRT